MNHPQHGTTFGDEGAGGSGGGSAGDAGYAARHRALTGWGAAATALILLTLLYDVLLTVGDWRVYLAVEHYLAGTVTEEEIQSADDFSAFFTAWKGAALIVAAGLVFLAWLWRARLNAEALGGARSQRRARGWTVGAWMVPVANLWIPYQVVTDVWKASAPRRANPGPVLALWWGCWLIGGMVGRAYTYQVMQETLSEDGLRRAVYLGTVSTALDVLAGVLVIHVVHRIGGWQTRRAAAAPR
ncbi:DUF4328 domain-containing protein [Kitasatospora sp. NPDC093550]|uniref:DUF4328 domain-containing protein n=1 Tax=Kitasatospora sp. NPDC093550 TaxID=3364089 RepID=UPI003823079A